ncbi:hypothetical protein GCM10010517_53750 [Streptosporangium fragile]|uniref:Glycoside hydrolase family 2 domain-containing protein n=1 Tax=Streptosporangium fragile TaxID=46186 RepID=A0ABN3W372_9ACTN
MHVTQNRVITVTVDGPGKLQGLGSDDPKSENNYADACCETFEGRAMAIIRPTGIGRITVRITSEQGESAQVVLHATRPTPDGQMPDDERDEMPAGLAQPVAG